MKRLFTLSNTENVEIDDADDSNYIWNAIKDDISRINTSLLPNSSINRTYNQVQGQNQSSHYNLNGNQVNNNNYNYNTNKSLASTQSLNKSSAANKTSSSSSSSSITTTSTAISAVQTIFPTYGEVFITACLAAFDHDLDRTIDALLCENLPLTLTKMDRTVQAVWQGKGGDKGGKLC